MAYDFDCFVQMAELSVEEIQELGGIFQQMFEGILTLTQTVSKQVDVSAGQTTAKYWKSMFNICFDVLAKVKTTCLGLKNQILPKKNCVKFVNWLNKRF